MGDYLLGDGGPYHAVWPDLCGSTSLFQSPPISFLLWSLPSTPNDWLDVL